MVVGNDISAEEALQKIVARVLRKKNIAITPKSSFKDMGVNSLDVVQIMVALEEALDIEIVDQELKNIPDMGGFLDYIQQKVKEKRRRYNNNK
jgi:acyl carrier protein